MFVIRIYIKRTMGSAWGRQVKQSFGGSLQRAFTRPQKVALSHGESGPPSNTRFLNGPYRSAGKRHLDRISRFCTTHRRAQHTDTQTSRLYLTVDYNCWY